jgi:hypothetical protein
MANSIKVSDKIRWSNDNMNVVATVVSIDKDNVLTVKLPSDATTTVASDKVVVIENAEFVEAIASVIEQLSNQIQYKSKDAIAMKTEIEVLQKEVSDLKAQVELANKAKTEADAKAEVAVKELDVIKKDTLAKSRYTDMKAVDALAMLGKDEKEILANLGNMPEAQYTVIKSIAQASFDKVAAANKAKAEAETKGKAEVDPNTVTDTKTNSTASEIDEAAASAANDKTSAVDEATAVLTTFTRNVLKSKKNSDNSPKKGV